MGFAKLKRLAAGGGFLRAVGTLASASVVGQLIMLAATPLITRLYSPADFGTFAVFTGLFSVLLVVSSLRYELAIPLPRSDTAALAVLSLAVVLNVAFAVLSLPLVTFFREPVSQLLNTPSLAHVLWILPLSILGAGTYRAVRLWAVRRHDFGAIAWTRVTQSIATVAVQAGCGLAGLGAIGLAGGYALGQTAGAVRLAFGAERAFQLSRRRLLQMRLLARRYIRFPKFDVAASLIDTMSLQLPNLALALLFGPAVAGLYMLGDRMLSTPLTLLSQSIGQVLYARSRQAMGAGRMGGLVFKVMLFIAAGLFIPALIMFFAGEALFAFVFGDVWRQAGLYASWIMIGSFGQFLFSSISLSLLATNSQSVSLMIHSGMLTARTAALLYGYETGSALATIIALSLVNFFGYLVAAGIVLRQARKHDAARLASAIAPFERL